MGVLLIGFQSHLVSHRAAYWDLYCSYYTLMIYLCQLLFHVSFCMQMTPSAANKSVLPLTVPYFKWTLILCITGFSQNKLRFNILKCFIIHFYKRSLFPILSSYYLNGELIATSTHGKDLGVTFSSDLSWNKHYEKISSKAYQTLGLIRRTFSLSSSVKAKKLLYLSLVRSKITYCSQVWRLVLSKILLSSNAFNTVLLNSFSEISHLTTNLV